MWGRGGGWSSGSSRTLGLEPAGWVRGTVFRSQTEGWRQLPDGEFTDYGISNVCTFLVVETEAACTRALQGQFDICHFSLPSSRRCRHPNRVHGHANPARFRGAEFCPSA